MTMDKQDALDLLKLGSDATSEAIETRYKQIAAFLDGNQETAPGLSQLLGQVNAMMTVAYEALPKAKTTEQKQDKQKESGIVQPQTEHICTAVKRALFPIALHGAGTLFSEQWWRVYKRAILVGLSLLGLAIYLMPDHVDWTPQQPRTSYSPGPTADSISHSYLDSTKPGAPDSTTASSSQSGVLDPNASTNTTTTTPINTWPPISTATGLTPLPNPNPTPVAAQQDPDKFVYSLMVNIKECKHSVSLSRS